MIGKISTGKDWKEQDSDILRSKEMEKSAMMGRGNKMRKHIQCMKEKNKK